MTSSAPRGRTTATPGSGLGLWAGAERVERLRFRRAPLLAATVCFAMGIGAERLGWRPAMVLLVAAGLMLGLSGWALRRGARVALVPVLGLWGVVGWWCAEVRPSPDPQTALLGYADNLSPGGGEGGWCGCGRCRRGWTRATRTRTGGGASRMRGARR